MDFHAHDWNNHQRGKQASKMHGFICTAHDMRLKIHCVSKCTFMDGVNDMLEITLIEHERRLIQFDSISRAHLFCDEHLLNHIKLIESVVQCNITSYVMYIFAKFAKSRI